MKISCNTNRNRGFTLVELQIAIVIMAIISILLLGALRLTSQAWRKVTDRQDAAEHQFLLSQMLRRHISGARLIKVRMDSGGMADSFIGGQDYLHYVAPFPRFINNGELYWWTLKIDWDESVQQEVLVLDYQPFDANLSLSFDADSSLTIEGQSGQRLMIASDIDTLVLAYYGVEGGDFANDDAQWLGEWNLMSLDGSRVNSPLPQLLNLKVGVVEQEAYQPWPEIVMALRYASEANSVNKATKSDKDEQREDEL